ncbi:MAG: hypothetical protein RLO21_12710, partial [Nitratireductor sp.]
LSCLRQRKRLRYSSKRLCEDGFDGNSGIPAGLTENRHKCPETDAYGSVFWKNFTGARTRISSGLGKSAKAV